MWFLYLCFTWPVGQVSGAGPGGALAAAGGGITVHVIRFYLPALGLIALLATWVAVRSSRWIGIVVVAGLVTASLLSTARWPRRPA